MQDDVGCVKVEHVGHVKLEKRHKVWMVDCAQGGGSDVGTDVQNSTLGYPAEWSNAPPSTVVWLSPSTLPAPLPEAQPFMSLQRCPWHPPAPSRSHSCPCASTSSPSLFFRFSLALNPALLRPEPTTANDPVEACDPLCAQLRGQGCCRRQDLSRR